MVNLYLLDCVDVYFRLFDFRDKNVIVRPVYDDGSGGDLEGKTPKECLEIHIEEMRRHIHGQTEDSAFCSNGTDYSLFIFYSGHGKIRDEEQGGAWSPSFEMEKGNIQPIGMEEIKAQMTLLCKCPIQDPKKTCKALPMFVYLFVCGIFSSNKLYTSTNRRTDG